MTPAVLALFLIFQVALTFAEFSPTKDSPHGILFNWKAYKSHHGKSFSRVEDMIRKTIYYKNSHLISKHNQDFAEGRKSYQLKMNHFGEYSSEEFNRMMNTLDLKRTINATKSIKHGTFLKPNHLKSPDSLDWRQYGYVTPVKNQGQCGSCWAFSATGALEGQWFRKTGQLISLSEQNLLDCVPPKWNAGCGGGGITQGAFQYVADNDGIDTEESYPYEAQDGSCRFKEDGVGATDVGFMDVCAGSENELLGAVSSHGPISVAIDASSRSFQFYSGGVYNNPSCSSTDLNHAVLVVGYGSDNGDDYWIVKNSWGVEWGNGGYINMSRNKNNQCGIATVASYPVTP